MPFLKYFPSSRKANSQSNQVCIPHTSSSDLGQDQEKLLPKSQTSTLRKLGKAAISPLKRCCRRAHKLVTTCISRAQSNHGSGHVNVVEPSDAAIDNNGCIPLSAEQDQHTSAPSVAFSATPVSSLSFSISRDASSISIASRRSCLRIYDLLSIYDSGEFHWAKIGPPKQFAPGTKKPKPKVIEMLEAMEERDEASATSDKADEEPGVDAANIDRDSNVVA